MEKFVINDDSRFGQREVSPDFEPNIKIVLAEDISAPDFNKLKALVGGGKEKEFGDLLFKTMILDWNLYDKDDKKIEITTDNIDGKLPKRLGSWIANEATESFFVIASGPSRSTQESPDKQ